MKVLLIEDEPSVAGLINKGLVENGHQVTIAPDGSLGLQLATDYSFDVLILDIMLPNMNGMELCRRLRDKNILTPILFLTALSTTENIVAGLNAGADDYLVKPFAMSELLARLSAILRRPPVSDVKTMLRVGDLEMDLLKRTVRRAGKAIGNTFRR